MNDNVLGPVGQHGLLRIALIAHALVTAYALVNGVAHQSAVLWKAWRGTLAHDSHLGSLLAVGTGLIVAGGFMSLAFGPLMRARPGLVPAIASVLLFGAVLAVIASRYGFRFLGGSIALASADLLVLGAAALRAS